MKWLHKALGIFGIRSSREREQPDYQALMRQALDRVDGAERMLREASTLEHLDLARSDLQAGRAQVQQVIRQAKRERGITLRSVTETEEIYRKMWEHMNAQEPERPTRKRGRTG